MKRSLLAVSRDQSGFALVALLALAEAVILVLITLNSLVIDKNGVSECLQTVTAAKQKLKTYPLGIVPANASEVSDIRRCKDFADGLAKSGLSLLVPGVSNLAKTTSNTLATLGECTINSVAPSPPVAGGTSLTVSAYVGQFGYYDNDGSQVTVSDTALPLDFDYKGAFRAVGTVAVSPNLSRAAGGTTSVITVRVRADIGRNADGTCPAGTDSSTLDKCFVKTFCSTSVTWKNVAPDLKTFSAAPSTVQQGASTPVTLTWAVNNATGVSIDNGVGDQPASGSVQVPPPADTTTYKLTALGPSAPPCAPPHVDCTLTAKVTVQAPPTVQLDSPPNNSVQLGDSVTVAGVVQNALPGQTVQISVNGAPKSTLTVVNGAFSTSVALAKKLSLGDFFLNNPDVSVTSAGSVAAPVTMGNSKSSQDVTNVITASVGTSSDSVTVSHALRVTGFNVTWSGCPSAPGDPDVPKTIGAGQSQRVGFVTCGAQGGFCATCHVHVSVDTSQGSGGNDATWVFRVQPCPAVSELGE